MKNFRLLFVCAVLIFLDIPSPLNSCGPSKPVDMDEKIAIEIIHDEENITRPHRSIIHTDLRAGDMITEELIKTAAKIDSEYYDKYFYAIDDEIQYEAKINSITVDYVSIGNVENQVTIPYQIQAEDFLDTYKTSRNVLVIYIHVDLDYELIPVE